MKNKFVFISYILFSVGLFVDIFLGYFLRVEGIAFLSGGALFIAICLNLLSVSLFKDKFLSDDIMHFKYQLLVVLLLFSSVFLAHVFSSTIDFLFKINVSEFMVILTTIFNLILFLIGLISYTRNIKLDKNVVASYLIKTLNIDRK
jgi:hypothetical protein